MPDSSIIISTMPIGGPMVPAKSGETPSARRPRCVAAAVTTGWLNSWEVQPQRVWVGPWVWKG